MTRRFRRTRELPEGYGAVKLSISLPPDLASDLRLRADRTGRPVSHLIADAVERMLVEEEQSRLDAALAADAEENLGWSAATAPDASRLLGRLEW
jgi:plasmid stability protein